MSSSGCRSNVPLPGLRRCLPRSPREQGASPKDPTAGRSSSASNATWRFTAAEAAGGRTSCPAVTEPTRTSPSSGPDTPAPQRPGTTRSCRGGRALNIAWSQVPRERPTGGSQAVGEYHARGGPREPGRREPGAQSAPSHDPARGRSTCRRALPQSSVPSESPYPLVSAGTTDPSMNRRRNSRRPSA